MRDGEIATETTNSCGTPTLKDHLFAPGWPRKLLTLAIDQKAFDCKPDTNPVEHRSVWPQIQSKAKRYFGTTLDWPAKSNQLDLLDGNRQPLVENRDGLAHVVYLMLELEKHREWATTFLFEEPDAFLHPGLQRQFIEYLIDYRDDCNNPRHQFILTTHSPYVINSVAELFRTPRDNVEEPLFLHTRLEQSRLDCRSLDKSGAQPWMLLDSIGHRPSDVLQPNGVIWVEGPSDVIYLRTWLDRYAKEKGELIRWGLDASILWYGGASLARCGASLPPFWKKATDTDAEHLWNLCETARHAAIVADIDTKGDGGWARKKRVKRQVEGQRGFAWIVKPRGGKGTIEDCLAASFQKDAKFKKLLKKKNKVEAAIHYREQASGRPFRELVDPRSNVHRNIRRLYKQIRYWA